MNPEQILKPRKALNPAYLKIKPNRVDIEKFKANLTALLDQSNDRESEEFHKNLVSDFLKKTWYDSNHFINTKGRNDLVIHNGPKPNSEVGVIIEAKKPTNKAEMPSLSNLNSKAFQELVLYYLRERIIEKNTSVRHLVVTNIYEWYIVDAIHFDRFFAQNRKLVKDFEEFTAGRKADTKTDFFYKSIAEPELEKAKDKIPFAYFDFRDYEKPLRNTDKADDAKLIALFKLLSPEHLLKLPFANDSNSLDRKFYAELLHLIGLTETKEGGKKLIGRPKKEDRNPGSLLENTINQLQSLDKLSRLDRPSQYGVTEEDRLFAVGLELCITWVNRILFLKLLEAQLLSYNKGNKVYNFLSTDKISDFDELNSLFFEVLARKSEDRMEEVKAKFAHVPYLNSSLFEPTEMEHHTLLIANLKNGRKLPIHPGSVLKDASGKKLSGELNALEYLFRFLDSYDFSSEGAEEIQEENKTLINASVLGLIFEKINGYKDGSFFTPGFITMYMCRETIRRAVVQKFKEALSTLTQNPSLTGRGTLGHENTKSPSPSGEGLGVRVNEINDFDELYDLIGPGGKFSYSEANSLINSLKICDPAVGSGHFLVSALNEIIAVKNDLRILQDRNGKRLKEYSVSVVNDELVVIDEDGELYEYNPNNPESQRIQETLFHEKQTIIENCLFGVDINPNSVKICRLRLWIELLKSAYYKPLPLNPPPRGSGTLSQGDGSGSSPLGEAGVRELETLPNIDINIKCGNSLVSRFALDADLSQTLKKSKFSIDAYRIAVETYRNAKNKEEKREMERLIDAIKTDFRSEITKNDPKIKKKNALAGELYNLTMQTGLFEEAVTEKKKRQARIQKVEEELNKLETEIEEIKANKIFENAFEWRFEFPEVLNPEGDFVGFDVVIGNPPYIRQEEFSGLKPYLQGRFKTFSGTADLYVYFVELGMTLLKKSGEFVFIIPNKWMRAGYGKGLRNYVKSFKIHELLDFGDLQVFEEATTYPLIVGLGKRNPSEKFTAVNLVTLDFPRGMDRYLSENRIEVLVGGLSEEGWTLTDSKSQKLLLKLKSQGVPLSEYVSGKIYRGVLTGYNEAFVIDQETRDRIIDEDPKSRHFIKPFLAGKEIKRYHTPKAEKYLILIPKGFTIKRNLPEDDPNYLSEVGEPPRYGYMEKDSAWNWFRRSLPALSEHLAPFRLAAEKRYDKGDFWWELRACDYYGEFEKPKILYQEIAAYQSFTFDNKALYTNNKIFIIPNPPLELLGFLNSSLVWFYLNLTVSKLRGNTFAMQSPYIYSIPILDQVWNNTDLAEIVEKILQLGDANPERLTLENQINQLVYKIYGLTEEEIGIVEGGV